MAETREAARTGGAAGRVGRARRALVRGLAGAGKTTAALARVGELLASGAGADRVVLVCATPTAAADARRALRARGAGEVRALTARELELDLLSDTEARRLTGRRPRVLGAFEELFLLEDMRATGVPARRLKGMLGFFRRSLTELADDDMASFIIDPREQAVLDALRAHLSAYDAMLDCEVSNLAVRYLRACPGAAARLCATHVVVDDYQCLNRASQALLDMLGAKTLTVFADPAHAAQGTDPFPYLAGLGEFVERNPGAEVLDLPDPAPDDARGAAAALVSSGYASAVSPGVAEERGRCELERPYAVTPGHVPAGGVRQLTYAGPDQELAGVACGVRAALEAGASPFDVLVLVPNRAWESDVCRELAARGVASQRLSGRALTAGSFRELGRCAAGRMYAALALLADPDDALAWRCWCGCGDYLARSATFAGVEELARTRGVGLAEALRLLDVGEAPAVAGQEGVLEAWRQGSLMIAELAGLRGGELLEELAHGLGLPAVPPEFGALLAEGPDDDPALSWRAPADADAAALFRAAYACETLPRLAGEARGVRVAEYGRACALGARHVFVCGAMNGWLLPHAYFDLAESGFEERARMDAEARWQVYELASCATGELTLSGFAACDLELAERMRLKGYKVRMGSDGRRVTSCRPSDAVAYALHAWGLAPLPPAPLLTSPAPAVVNA